MSRLTGTGSMASVGHVLAPLDLYAGLPAPQVAGDAVSGALQLVDLDRPIDDGRLPALLAALRARTALVVGLAERVPHGPAAVLAEALDLTLVPPGDAPPWAVPVPDVPAAAAALQSAVAAAPRAALVLAAVLRAVGHLPPAVAIAAEASGYSTLLAGPEHRAWLLARGAPRAVESDLRRVALTRDGDVLHVRLDRPRRRNAMDAAMRRDLVDAFAVALADPALHVRLSGAGPVFCAGGDLDEFGSLADPATAWVVRTAVHPGQALLRLGARAEAHVHGPCVGAGVELPAFAARLVADPDATFRLPELAMGLVPGAGGTVSLPRRAGRWRTAWMVLSGAPVDAGTALAWGLVDAVEPVRG